MGHNKTFKILSEKKYNKHMTRQCKTRPRVPPVQGAICTITLSYMPDRIDSTLDGWDFFFSFFFPPVRVAEVGGRYKSPTLGIYLFWFPSFCYLLLSQRLENDSGHGKVIEH